MKTRLTVLSLGALSTLGGAAALLAACSGRSNDTSAETVGQGSADLYAAEQILWPGGDVDVCFEPSATDDSHWRSVVQAWTTSAWQANAEITFHGWGTCDTVSPGDGVRISFQDVGPYTAKIGFPVAGIKNGMVLNNAYAKVTRPGPTLEASLGWVAVHEFGHALGYPHEQDRPDALSSASPTSLVTYYGNAPACNDGGPCNETGCITAYLAGQLGSPFFNTYDWFDENTATGALSPIGFYDHVSVMNYCNTAGRYANSGVPSQGDLAGTQKIYGRPHLGSDSINSPSDPASVKFPLSTVNLQTPGNLSTSCTGVLLSSTTTPAPQMKILTAAHCNVGPTTTVQFYPTGQGTGDTPNGTVFTASSTTPVATPPIVGPCDPDVPGSFPSTCVVNGPDDVYFADLAVLTVDSAAPAGYVPVALGTSGSLSSDSMASADDAGTPTAWEVGTGWGGTMQWGPISSSLGDDAGSMGISSDYGGFFMAGTAPFSQRGDTGGPVFEYVTPPLASANGLVLMGITMTVGPCQAPDTCNDTPALYTSVVYPANYTWLVGQGGAPAAAADADAGDDTDDDDLSSFGASTL